MTNGRASHHEDEKATQEQETTRDSRITQGIKVTHKHLWFIATKEIV